MSSRRAAAYVRAANWEDAQEKLAEQERHIREWADLNGYEVVEVYAEIGSGHREDRPELQRLLSDSQARKHEAIIVVDYARLFRNLSLMTRFLEMLQDGLEVDLMVVGPEGHE
jgi:DNA invertase Pin-like site-specific DNA recombinase